MYVYNETAGVAGAYSILPATPPPVYAPTATIVGTDTMQPNASCYFFVTSSLSYTTVSWTVSGVEVGTNYDLYYSAGSSFLLEVQVTDGTNAAFASKTVTVSSDASTCYIQ